MWKKNNLGEVHHSGKENTARSSVGFLQQRWRTSSGENPHLGKKVGFSLNGQTDELAVLRRSGCSQGPSFIDPKALRAKQKCYFSNEKIAKRVLGDARRDAIKKNNKGNYLIALTRIDPGIHLLCGGSRITGLIDSGAQINLCKLSFIEDLNNKGINVKIYQSDRKVKSVSGEQLKVYGKTKLHFYVLNKKLRGTFLIVGNQTDFPGPLLLGIQFLKRNSISCDFGAWKISIGNKMIPMLDPYPTEYKDASTIGGTSWKKNKLLHP